MKKFIFLIMLFIVFIGCDNEKTTYQEEDTLQTFEDYTDQENTRYYNKECIEGHVYYGHNGRLAPKINDNGTPTKCWATVVRKD